MRDEKISWTMVITASGIGLPLILFNDGLLTIDKTVNIRCSLYCFTLAAGYLCVLASWV